MDKKSVILVTVEESFPDLTLEEICHACGVAPEFVQELIDYAAIEPKAITSETLLFDIDQLRRVKTAVHLHQDLEVNLAGAALVLDMMDEIEHLRSEIKSLKKYFK